MSVERRAGAQLADPELVWPTAPFAFLGLVSVPLFTFPVLSELRTSTTLLRRHLYRRQRPDSWEEPILQGCGFNSTTSIKPSFTTLCFQ